MVSENELICSANHRGLTYGDGIFETMISNKGDINYFDQHLHRLQKGMSILGMVADKLFIKENIFQHILELIHVNDFFTSSVRVKLIVWRKSGGLFTPLNNGIDFMISVKEQPADEIPPLEAELSQQIRLYPSPYSIFKTCNMLPYVMAGMEKKKRKLSELVLLSYSGHIAECSASNIFWVKDDEYFTPSLETGCIEGIMRNVIIEKLAKQEIIVKEVKAFPEALRQADAAFTSNVSGIKPIHKFEKKIFNNEMSATILNYFQ